MFDNELEQRFRQMQVMQQGNWVDAYFRETLIQEMKVSDSAIVTLMSYPKKPITGKIESIGWGIAQSDGVELGIGTTASVLVMTE